MEELLVNQEKKIKLKCSTCNCEQIFESEKKAYLEGWDFPIIFGTQFIFCYACALNNKNKSI